MRTPALAISLAVALASPLAAQDSAAVLDSLEARLQRTEDALERLQRQLEEQAQSKVGSRLRNHVTLSGLVITNAFYNNARVNNSDFPQFLVPPDTSGLPNRHLGASVRQTRLGLTVSNVRTLNAILTADLQMDFAGGQQPSSTGRTSPLLRVRTATARLDWRHFGVLIGQEMPLISPNNPVSFAASGIPGFTAAGNLWLWIPQARLTWETGSGLRAGIQAAALSPTTPTAQPAFSTEPDDAEKSGRPALQGRVYVGWGDGDSESQFGAGVHRGWIATTGDTLLSSEAFSADWRLALGERFVILGEAFFNGQALAGLGGGGVGQNLGLNGVPVRSRGGWAQLNVRPSAVLEVGGGAGLDDPDEADLPATGRGRNVVFSGHLHYRPGGGLLLGFEFRRIETTYAAGRLSGNHLNWFAGVAF
jgi:hypothetical protein